MTDEMKTEERLREVEDELREAEAALERIRQVIEPNGPTPFGPKSHMEVAIFVEAYMKVDEERVKFISRQLDNAKHKADHFRRLYEANRR